VPDQPESVDELVQGDQTTPLDELGPEKAADVEDKKQDTELKKSVAKFTMWATAIQLGVADLVFVLYATSQWGNIPVAAIDVWLGAVVVQVIGLMAIVSHYLFPSQGRRKP
jgi:hypothetical protein